MLIGFVCLPFTSVRAAEDFSQYLSRAEISAGASVGSPDGQFFISFPAGDYTASANIYFSQPTVASYPDGEVSSAVYSYYILTKARLAEFEIALHFSTTDLAAKHLWRFDYRTKQWEELTTRIDVSGQLAIATLSDFYGEVVLLSDPVQIFSTAQPEYSSFDKKFSFSPSEKLTFSSVEITSFNQGLYPEDYVRVSDIYQYDLHQSNVLAEPMNLVFSYQIVDFELPLAFFWDNNLAQWQKLPTVADLDEGVVSAQTVLPFSRVALFAVPDTWAGEASWYKYKNCNCAASRDYPKGTALRVTCLSNSRSVDVVVNDFGPELWTGRLIDLDAVAFAQLGSLRWGVTDVKIELLP